MQIFNHAITALAAALVLSIVLEYVPRERGVGRTEALQEAVRVRLRPILMTSATMIFGMLPLALKLEA